MMNDYERDYRDFLQSMKDSEDVAKQREKEQTEQKFRVLANGLRESLSSLRAFQQRGFDIVAMRHEILAVWKQCLSEVWGVPEAKPLIDLLFPSSINA